MASRGSTALPAACSQILHLQRMEEPEAGQQQKLSGKRILRTEGRGGAPEEMLLEMEDGLWFCRGSAEELFQEQEKVRARASLNERQAEALDHVEETWNETITGLSANCLAALMGIDERVARRLLEQLGAKRLVRRTVVNLGMGKGGLSYRYAPFSTADNSLPTPDTPDTPDGEREEVSAVEEPAGFDTFDSVEAFTNGAWGNGWTVSESSGGFVTMFNASGHSLRLSEHLVRPCEAAKLGAKLGAR